jgi:hypothetical protein
MTCVVERLADAPRQLRRDAGALASVSGRALKRAVDDRFGGVQPDSQRRSASASATATAVPTESLSKSTSTVTFISSANRRANAAAAATVSPS